MVCLTKEDGRGQCEWTDAGHLRHCTFVGMREDKKPTEVVAKLECHTDW